MLHILTDYLRENDLEERFQSAYKRFRSTETALIKGHNAIVTAIDNQEYVIDHDLLPLPRLSSPPGIK